MTAPAPRPGAKERLARIDRMIDKYRAAKHRQLLRRVMKRWRRAEADQLHMALEAPPERIH